MDPFEQLQTDFAARLNSLAYFSDITVEAIRSFRQGDKITTPETIAQRINAALAGLLKKADKCGVAIQVLLPALSGDQPDVPGPRLKLILAVRIIVNPLINLGTSGTGKSVSAIAKEVIQAGHQFYIAGLTSLTTDKNLFEATVVEEKGWLVGTVIFEAMLQLDQPTSVAMPSITVAASVTLACATSGASIYYTTDGSFPWSGNGTLYSAPFTTPASGTVIRAAAYKTGINGSNVNQSTIP